MFLKLNHQKLYTSTEIKSLGKVMVICFKFYQE